MSRPPKKTLAAAIGGILLALASSAIHAAGLGKLSVNSALGQPLSAEIELVSLQPGEFEALAARVASPEAYTEARIEYSPLLRQLRFTVERKADGRPILKISSGAPINEPFLDVLVELTWPAGRLVREYPILLDPPGFNEARIQAPVAAVAPLAAAPAASTAAPITPSQLPSARAEASTKSDTYGPVKRGDTLSKIANEMRGEGITLDQMLVALFRENKQAFGNKNMNLLKTGQILRIPTAAEVAKITQAEARKEVSVQVADWKAYREQIAGTVAAAPAAKPAATNVATGQLTAPKPAPTPEAPKTDQLKIAKADTVAPAGAAGAAGAKTVDGKVAAKDDAVAKQKALEEAKSRIAELEKQKADAQKLIDLKAAPPGAKPADGKTTQPTQVAQATPPAAPGAAPAAPAAAPAAPGAAPATPPADAAAAPKPAPKPAPKAPPPPPPEPTVMDMVMDNLPIIAGAGGAALLGAGGFVYMRRRKKAGSGGATTQSSSLMPSDLKPNTVTGAKAGGLVDTGNSSFLTDFDKTGPGAIDTDEVDPVAEADVYIAYGRDAQAEEILKEAMARDKSRHEIPMKLLEIYHARKSAPAFETVARELKEAVGEDSPLWAKAASMGASIDPNNALYGGASGSFQATAAFAAGGAALAAGAAAGEAEVAKPDLDFDLGFDDTGTATATSAPAIDITAPATDQPAPEADAGGLDFDLGLNVGAPPAPSATAAPAPEADAGGLDFDLGLDIGGAPAPAAADAAAPAAPAAEASGFDFDLSSLSLETPVDQPVAAAPAPAAAPALDLSDLSLDLDAPAESAAPADGGGDPGAVATKLELAKAYIEIGDTDGAKEILTEVAREGNAAQQDEAKTILAGL